ncbi:MAG: hypothetical protein ABI664_24030, partial [bacterium]
MHFRTLCRATLIAFTTMALPSYTHAQDSPRVRQLVGKVTEEGSALPATSVQILLEGSLIGTSRDDGTYSVRLPAGAATVTFRRIGFRRVDQVVGPAVATLDVVMGRDLLRLSEVVVTGQATGIERRNSA